MKIYTKVKVTYHISKCPHCGNILSRADSKRFGQTLVNCPSCGKPALDGNITEMAIHPWQWYIDREHKAAEPRPALKVLVYIWLPALFAITLITRKGKDFGDLTFVFAALLILWALGISKYKIYELGTGQFYITEKFKQDYEESAQRLANPAYADLLRKAGLME